MSFLSNSTQSEIILSTSNDKTQPMYAWDIRSGAIISNFKQSSSTNQSTTFINFKQSIHSAIILSASSQQPLLTLFSWHKVCDEYLNV